MSFLDVEQHRTKDGRPLKMLRLRPEHQPGSEKGFDSYKVVAVLEGAHVGTLTFTWIPDFDARYPDAESFKKGFGRLFASEQGRASARAFHSTPYVAAVCVDFLHHREYIGLAVYREAARWLADRWGLPLRSGDPNHASQALWKKLEQLGEPIVMLDVMDGRDRCALDYVRTS